MNVITRFAPSPTGNLHIGGARTALFNYLFAKHYSGKFLLRIEDTDISRSKEEYVDSILNGLKWLNLDYDEIIFQSSRVQRHKEIAYELVKRGMAYFCFESQDEVNRQREAAIAEGRSFKFNSPWRDVLIDDIDKKNNYVIRIKSPIEGEMIINDLVQGEVKVRNDHLDDMVILRSDGTATYMLAVVVDDHDMNISHIIRGDDHLNNAFKQKLIYEAMGWHVPEFAHISLIHGQDGSKMSKRHGATNLCDYREMGYLPEAVNNYLLRLGWSHGNDEIISREQAINWFNIDSVGKSAAKFDQSKLDFLNSYYIKNISDERLMSEIFHFLNIKFSDINLNDLRLIQKGLSGLRLRAKTITELVDMANFYLDDKYFLIKNDAMEVIKSSNKEIVFEVIEIFNSLENFDFLNTKEALNNLAIKNNIKIADLMKPLRALICGSNTSPSVFEVIDIMGKDMVISRLKFINNL